MVNIPNTLTVFRICLVIVLVVVLLSKGGLFLGTVIYALGVVTDYLDGYLARRRNEVTRLGIVLDPIADKLLNAVALLWLMVMSAVPAWVVVIIIGRELLVTWLRNVAASKGVLIPASRWGKAKMGFQVAAILTLLIGMAIPWLRPLGEALLIIAVVVTVVSAFLYGKEFRRRVLTA